jgi:3-deoxy-manno-octulosonate cytidylyltransferase (CMP-KDO synthetase)
VVIVQGDEPVLDPQMVHLAIEPFKKNPKCLATNLIQKIDPEMQDPRSYNVVKAVINTKNQIVYMSREPIPTPQRAPEVKRTFYRQLGVMGFSAEFLQVFGSLPRGPLEQAEGVEMNRVLENGYPLESMQTDSACLAIDVPEDVPGIERALKNDKYTSRY